MRFFRPLLFLIAILIIGFIFRRDIPDWGNSIKQFSFNIEQGNIGNTTRALEQKIEDNLPPPLRGGSPTASSSSTADNSALLNSSSIISITNSERRENGNLPSLSENATLNAEARAKVDDMFAKQYFEHTSPSGRGPADLAKTAGYQYIVIGENLALGNFKNNQALLDAWMNSPGHRANILNSKYTEMGAAAKEGMYEGQKTWLAVQEFGRPLSACSSPDSALETKIQNEKADLDIKEEALEQKKSEIDNAYPKSGDSYNAKVAEYNSMVSVYNAEVNETKANINTYNQEVQNFNSCAAS